MITIDMVYNYISRSLPLLERYPDKFKRLCSRLLAEGADAESTQVLNALIADEELNTERAKQIWNANITEYKL